MINLLSHDPGVNLPGVHVMSKLLGRMNQLEVEMEELLTEIERGGSRKLQPRGPIAL